MSNSPKISKIIDYVNETGAKESIAKGKYRADDIRKRQQEIAQKIVNVAANRLSNTQATIDLIDKSTDTRTPQGEANDAARQLEALEHADSGIIEIALNGIADLQPLVDESEPRHEVKEVLREQLESMYSGYEEFTNDVGELPVSEEKFSADFESWLIKAEKAGALEYYAEWLEKNPSGGITIAASPNKVIKGKRLEIAHSGSDKGQLITAALGHNYSDCYSDEELSGAVSSDADVSFVVYTSGFNLPYGNAENQQVALYRQREKTPGAHIPSYKDCVAMRYRLRQEDDGMLIGSNNLDDTCSRLIDLVPSRFEESSRSLYFVPKPYAGISGQDGRSWSGVKADNRCKSELARFVAGPEFES
jgi:hypothetical protein